MQTRWSRYVNTGILLLIAVLAGWFIWQHYFNSLWTRDAKVVARAIQVAPDVAGTITAMAVSVGDRVKAGDLLFRIDPKRYHLVLEQAQAALSQSRTSLALKQKEVKRRKRLGKSISREALDRAEAAVANAQAEEALAKAKLARAKLNLNRTNVVAPVSGQITRLGAFKGDYAQQGEAVVSLVQTDKMWVEAYFKETKVHRIHPGDKVKIKVLGLDQTLKGQVAHIGKGIANANQRAGNQGLPSVTPSFDWVRLAQRIPVIIHFQQLPDNVRLSSGMTASVRVTQ